MALPFATDSGTIPAMAPKIQVLQQTLINKIAAGEVIVRPASVVKETVENSFDAGAEHVRVEISKDCRNISIIDDGCGMSEEDARRCVLRHSTSKIRDFDDLERLTTRGFRGEAIASILSVSRFELLTREKGEIAGVRLTASGGKVERVEPVGTAEGTTIHVRDLFYNVPARLKFLKSPTAELNALMAVLVPQVLSRPDVGVACVRDGDVRFDVPARQDLKSRIEDLLGSSVRGKLIPVDFERDDLSVRGYVSLPEASRKDRRWQFININGRPIDPQPLSYPIQEAYRGLLMKGRFPVLVLNITVSPDEVDVNVHPTKEEVRFREERKITGLTYRAIEEALARQNLMPSMELTGEAENGANNEKTGPPARPERVPGPPPQRPTSPSRTSDPSLPFVFSPQGTQPYRPSNPSRMPARPGGAPSLFPTREFAPRPPSPEPDAPAPETCEGPPPETSEIDVPNPARLTFGDGPPPRALGQIGYNYIAAEWGDDLLLIDQHAAHERLLYHQFLQKDKRDTATQMLMVPIPFGVSAEDRDLVERLLPLLREMGMEVAEQEDGTFAVTALPSDLDSIDVASMVQDVLDDLREETDEPRLLGADEIRDHILVRMACHAAIKAGQALSPEEIAALIRDLAAARMSFTCPHGRPTAIRLSREQLDRQFGRI